MAYVASPSHSVGDPARATDLQQCLDSARKYLDETSRSSDAEKEAEIITSAVEAGWEDVEVRTAIAADAHDQRGTDEVLKPTIGIVPSSSM